MEQMYPNGALHMQLSVNRVFCAYVKVGSGRIRVVQRKLQKKLDQVAGTESVSLREDFAESRQYSNSARLKDVRLSGGQRTDSIFIVVTVDENNLQFSPMATKTVRDVDSSMFD